MPQIAYDLRLPLPGAMAVPSSPVFCSWAELVDAAIRTGFTSARLLRHGKFARSQAQARTSTLRAYLKERSPGFVCTSLYSDLDPTEKSYVAYYVGMAVAGVLLDRLFGVSQTLHVSRYKTLWTSSVARGVLPDLIGRTVGGRWIVIEAKGRSRRDRRLEKRIASQKGGIARISGHRPALRIGVITSLGPSPLAADLVDPDPPRGASIDIPDVRFTNEYYAPFIDLLAVNSVEEEIHGRRVVTTLLDDVDARVGLELNTLARATGGSPFDRLAGHRDVIDDERSFIGRDGSVVVLGDSWASAQMSLEPLKREAMS